MPQCKKCHKQLVWPQPYKKGDRPVEPNRKNTKHICGNTIQSCSLCPSGKVMGTPMAITQHKKFYHPNNEQINSWQYELRFQNKYIPHKMRKLDNESKETDYNSLDIY